MKKPKLQLALDQNTLGAAEAVSQQAGPLVDVIEVGTILALQVGATAITTLRTIFPDKPLVADVKCADAGTTIAQNIQTAGADLMTVIDSASLATMAAAKAIVPGIQVELYSAWTYQKAKQWLAIGIDQVIYHQSRDALLAGQTWGGHDLAIVSNLIEMGFKVSVTGGLSLKTIPLFAGLPVDTFIAGRAISDEKEPATVAQAFQDLLKQEWS